MTAWSSSYDGALPAWSAKTTFRLLPRVCPLVIRTTRERLKNWTDCDFNNPNHVILIGWFGVIEHLTCRIISRRLRSLMRRSSSSRSLISAELHTFLLRSTLDPTCNSIEQKSQFCLTPQAGDRHEIWDHSRSSCDWCEWPSLSSSIHVTTD